MKKNILFYLLCLLPAIMYAQEDQQATPSANSSNKIYCYINNVRLDSIEATYATFGTRANGLILFDYGQLPNNKKALTLTDNKNNPIFFATTSDAFVLNLLYYNGWELFKTIPQYNAMTTYVLKKRVK